MLHGTRIVLSSLQLTGTLLTGTMLTATMLTGTLLTANLVAQQPGSGEPVDFDRDIRPILSNHCFQCHGPAAKNRKGDLRLDRKADALKVIQPGNAKVSELIARIVHADKGERMPPPSANKPLKPAQIDKLTRWIDQGAPWQEHWAFVAPRKPALPRVKADLAKHVVNPVDRFILRGVDRKGLAPTPRADRRTLLRRVHLDLIGLPPTQAEQAAFLNDDSPDSYERLVDRLLASPHYGEHMARFWLDAARYGDTHGLHLDNYREMWPYRDWVVRMFNQNQRWDRFVVEQLAGDLLPEPTVDQRIASGFNRCHITTAEGGSIKEEVYVRNVIDRVSTTGTVFFGMSFGCCVCHDHKFDPVSQREFYEMFAFFNNLQADPMDGNRKDHAPVLKIASAEQTAQLAKLDQADDEVRAMIDAELSKLDYEEPEARDAQANKRERRRIVWVDDALPEGADAGGDGLTWTEDLAHSGRRAMRRTSQGNQQHFFKSATTKLRVAAGDVLFAWVYVDPKDPPAQLMLQWNDDGDKGWNHRAYWGQNKIKYGRNNTTERRRLGRVPKPGKWTQLRIPVSKVGLRPGMAVHGIAFTQFGGTAYWDTIGIETSAEQGAVDFLWVDDQPPKGSKLHGEGRKWQWVKGDAPKPVCGDQVLRRSGKGLTQDFFTDAPTPLRVQHGDKLFAHVWLDPKDSPTSVQLQFLVRGSWSHRARWGAEAHGPGTPNGGDFVAGKVPKAGEWIRLEVDLASVGLQPGDRITGWAFTKVDGTVYWDGAGVHTFGPPDDAHLHSLMAWEAIAKDDTTLPKDVRRALVMDFVERNPAQQTTIRNYWLRKVHAATRPLFAKHEAELAANAKRRTAIQKAIPTTLVMKERATPKDAFVLRRGQYNLKGDKVERRTPRVFPPMPKDLPRNRLGFAQWLIAPNQPLTARVTVNRFWQQVFGTGLVKTSEDFGNQGERPSHPELLDWLAVQFQDDGWDVKKLMKRLVMSNTYRQSSNVSTAALAVDPENRLLARGPRFRLDGETIRDQALAISGLLVRKVGGPGVKPPQPAGLWKAVGYSSSNTARFVADKTHEKVHRRSLYTFWKRTSPPPQMTTFDAPSREECRVRRERTNTPLQALLLMNDPQYVEAARHFAQRILTEGGATDAARAAWAHERATGHPPTAEDTDDVLDLLRREQAAFAKDLAAANKLIAIGTSKPDAKLAPATLAAWTMVANLIFNLDRVVTKD